MFLLYKFKIQRFNFQGDNEIESKKNIRGHLKKRTVRNQRQHQKPKHSKRMKYRSLYLIFIIE